MTKSLRKATVRVLTVCFHFSAPAIRIIDEQGHEIRDRYYKIGSTIDLTCQVATSYIKNNSSNAPSINYLLQAKPIWPTKDNEIDAMAAKGKKNADENLHKRIGWKKDNDKVSKDALFNLR